MDNLSVRSKIIDYRRRGQYIQAHQYISELPITSRQSIPIAIECAWLYLVQGHYIHAFDACMATDSQIPVYSDPSAGLALQYLDIERLCLTVLTAFIGISRYGRIQTALRVTEKLQHLHLDVDTDGKLQIAEETDGDQRSSFPFCSDEVLNTNRLCPHDSEYMVLLLYFFHYIRIVAAENGLINEFTAKQEAAIRINALVNWCISCQRFREARLFTYLGIGLTHDSDSDLAALNKLAASLQDESFVSERAFTHLDIAKTLFESGQSDDAQTHVKLAEQLFNDIQHVFGLMDLMDMQVTVNDQIPLEQKLDWKLCAADIYLKKACYQQGLRCLILAVPVSIEMGKVRDQTEDMVSRIQREIDHIGAVYMKIALFVNTMAQSLVRAPEYGYARECLEEYLTSLPPEIPPRMEGILYASLRAAYVNLKNLDRAHEAGEQALLKFRLSYNYDDVSDGALGLAMVKVQQANLASENKDLATIHVSNALNCLVGWAMVDEAAGEYEQAIQKCVAIANLAARWQFFTYSDNWLARAEKLANMHHLPLIDAEDISIQRAVRELDYDGTVDLALQSLQVQRNKPQKTDFEVVRGCIRASTAYHMRFVGKINAIRQDAEDTSDIGFDDIMEALKLANEALHLLRGSASGGSEMVVNITNYVYDLLSWAPGELRQSSELLVLFLNEMEATEQFCDSLRRSSLTLDHVGSLLEKRQIVADSEFRKLYANAVHCSLEIGDSSKAWLWLQRSKGRALSDFFGLRVLIPETLIRSIEGDGEAREMFEHERVLMQAITTATSQDHVSVRRRADEHRVAMRKHPLLTQLLDIREGVFDSRLSLDDLQPSLRVSAMTQDHIKYVDWTTMTSLQKETQFVLFVRSMDNSTQYRILDISLEVIDAWKRRVFDEASYTTHHLSRENANATLRKLHALIDPLLELTEEGDLLVLSPAGILNQIPIHAVRFNIKNETWKYPALIERNPVIYCSSASLFRNCHMRAAAAATSSLGTTPLQERLLFAIREGAEDQDRIEEELIYQHTEKLKGDFNFNVIQGQDVNKYALRDKWSQAQWIHYHGHAEFESTDALGSKLVLAKPRESFGDTEAIEKMLPDDDDDTLDNSGHLTVGDAFAMDLRAHAPHITLIACASGAQDFAPGNEPLGFIPAWLFAGATSVLGTLWPVESRTGRIFSEMFYSKVNEQIRSPNEGQCIGANHVVNLAKVLQETIIEMIRKKDMDLDRPLNWAPYILSGSWFHAVRR